MPPVDIAQARRAKARLKELVADDENVVGIGVTKAEAGYAVKLNLREAARGKLPASVEGVPVVSEVVGKISARTTTKRTR